MVALLISLLIFLVVAGLALYAVYWILSLLPIPQPMRNIALAICILIALLIGLQRFGVLSL